MVPWDFVFEGWQTEADSLAFDPRRDLRDDKTKANTEILELRSRMTTRT
jgi:hypothetical protein